MLVAAETIDAVQVEADNTAMEQTLTLNHPERAAELFGPADVHLRTLREAFGVQIFARGGQVKITGAAERVSKAVAVLQRLEGDLAAGRGVDTERLATAIGKTAAADQAHRHEVLDVYVAGQLVKPKTPGQERYIKAVLSNDMIFCTGPAGSGKTYLAVAFAVHMLKHSQAKRLILVRPAVEAGEKLGFLPGDMQAKVNPYLRPLFDALHDMMDYDQIRRFMVNDLIEVIPLAFMRGRTLNDSVIILDEAQNTTVSQMLMFLTRMGHGSKVIVTGDASQIDLPEKGQSGLIDAMRRLRGIDKLACIELEQQDIVRHSLVQNIVEAYGGT
jgi:phosphate starvation-inducible protein PhoH and related proteins